MADFFFPLLLGAGLKPLGTNKVHQKSGDKCIAGPHGVHRVA